MDWLNNSFAGIYELGGSASFTNFSTDLYNGKFYSHIGVYSVGLAFIWVIFYYFLILGNKTKISDWKLLNSRRDWLISMLILGLFAFLLMKMEADAYFLSIAKPQYDTQALTQLSVINSVFVMVLFYGFSFIRKVTKGHQGKNTPH